MRAVGTITIVTCDAVQMSCRRASCVKKNSVFSGVFMWLFACSQKRTLNYVPFLLNLLQTLFWETLYINDDFLDGLWRFSAKCR